MKPLQLVIYALACFRLATLFAIDSGPFKMLSKLRSKLKREAKQNKIVAKSDVAKGIECQRCNSVWFAAPIATYALFSDQFIDEVVIGVDVFLLCLALSSLSIIIHRTFPPK